jgi:TonB-dependent receptor
VLFGTVRDDDSGDRLAGANVLVVRTTLGASTDLDGKYRVEGIPAGTHEVRVSFTGYTTKTLPAVVIKAGDSEKLNVRLEPESGGAASFVIDDLIVTGERVLSTEIALITERMKAITIGDAISAERISKSPDGSSSDVLKRIPGLSIMDDKFVYVRGMSDRYSVTWLDGVATSGTDTDTDRKSFTFDNIPSSLLASAVIVKSGSPDLPGDLTGGLVRLNTRDIPEERLLSLSAGSGYDPETTTRTMLRSEGSSTDWRGEDDGIRALPEYEHNLTGNYTGLTQELPNTWSSHGERAPYDGSYSLTYGDRYDFGIDDGNHVLGLIAGAKYSASYGSHDFTKQRTHQSVTTTDYDGTRNSYKVIWSGLLNAAYSPSPRHRLSVRGIYVRDAQDKVTHAVGQLNENMTPRDHRRYTIEWDERWRLGLQGGGTHQFGRREGPALEWKVFRSESEALEPDRKTADYQRRGSGEGYLALSTNERSWSELQEETNGYRADLTWPLGDVKVKVGTYSEDRERNYTTDAFWTPAGSPKPENAYLALLPIGEIFDPENYGGRKFKFMSKTSHTGEYSGSHALKAYYGMVDLPLTLWRLKLRLAGGVRVEESDQRVEALKREGDEEPIVSRIDKTDTLPSVSLTYTPWEKTNLRLAYYQSVNRPELREMADVRYHDFNRDVNIEGNPDLERALIQNFDVRAEWFPGADEVLAVSYFHKRIENAIEVRLVPSTDYKHLTRFFNAEEGFNHGFEIEARKSLGFLSDRLGDPFRFLGNVTIQGNYARVYSEVDYFVNIQEGWKTRALQGQSPWMLNLSILYESEALGTSINLLYNAIGPRTLEVGEVREDDVWEETRDVLDLAVTQKLFDRWEVKMTAENMTGSSDGTTYGVERTPFDTEQHSVEYSVSVGYKL